MKLAAAAAARLGGLYPADDPRIAWLPDAPDAAEAHLRLDGSCDLVIGYAGHRFPELDVFVERCAGHAAELGHADHRPAWERWIAATGTAIADAGAQLGAARGRLQVYLRGYYDPAAVSCAFAAVGCEASPRLVGNALALFAVHTVEMMGLELADDRIGAAVYLAVPNAGGAAAAAALDEAIGFVIAAIQPAGRAAREAWRAVAADLLATVSEEHVYVSFDPTPALGWVKVDVGARPLALADRLGRRLGLPVGPMIEAATARGLTSPSHVSLRFAGGSPALSIYHPLA
ncbi:MAG TPA: hypothetical protein VFP84_26150 [Kofleriaceae bacterium]|nr:hypothetical protein [Kofleriaceae bacterium]